MGQVCSTNGRSISSEVQLTKDTLEANDILSRSASISSIEKSKLSTERSTRASSSSKLISRRSAQIMPQSPVDLSQYLPEKLLSKKIWEGEKICQSNEKIRQSFVDYIFSYAWVEKVELDINEMMIRRRPTQDTQEITFNDYSVRSRSTSADSRDMEAVATAMMRVTQLKIKDSMESANKKSALTGRGGGRGGRGGGSKASGMVETVFAPDQLKAVVLTTIWPIFMDSEAYSCALRGEEYVCYEEEVGQGGESNKGLGVTWNMSESEKIKRLKDIYTYCVLGMTEEEVQGLLLQGAWGAKVLETLETLPLSVSISSPAPGHPIIYVNKAFESTTLYSKADVYGKNHGILQRPGAGTEEDQRAKIGDALRKGEGIKIAITNFKKNDQEFLNFLALRPVIRRGAAIASKSAAAGESSKLADSCRLSGSVAGDSIKGADSSVKLGDSCKSVAGDSGECVCVLGVQYDITKAEASLREIKMVNDFLSLMCNVLKA